MPRSPSPRRDRERSRSPRRDRDRARSRSPRRDRDDGGDRDRDRDGRRSRPWTERRPKELSFYKKSSAGYGHGPSSRAVGELGEEESAKERAQRRERGEVPRRFGGTREQGVRNTMGNVGGLLGPAAGVVSFKRTSDPLDRIGVKGGDRRDDRRDERRDDRRDDRRARDDRDRRDDRSRMHPDRAGRSEEKPSEDGKVFTSTGPATKIRAGRMMEVTANDRMGRKVRIKCLPTDTVGDLKKLIAAQTGTNAQKIVLKKGYNAFKDHVQLQDYEINDGMSLEMY